MIRLPGCKGAQKALVETSLSSQLQGLDGHMLRKACPQRGWGKAGHRLQ